MIQLISIVHAGAITDAPDLSQAPAKILVFLLSVFSVVAIIGIVVSGMLYFFAIGDERMMETAKKSFVASITGLAIGLGSLVIIKLLGSFFG